MNQMMNDTHQLAKQVVDMCIDSKKTIVAAESMTGGLILSELTSIPNASFVIDRSYIVYSNQSKTDVLGVSSDLLARVSAYSFEVINAMIKGLDRLSNANIKIAVSGIAGPKSFNEIDVGTVFIGIGYEKDLYTYKVRFDGERQAIRHQTVQFIFKKIIGKLSKGKVKE